ncbi:Smr/MutS family protein [Paracoccus tegillarcae]|uniref:DNA mismatch repair protein MutS n=1 Tax=Paracoccus tegillarcae TaxID=1529068 RepID=A0A2K9EE32_9RHOB|nr:Smr/MutS family protein [Paracoccus tegillarcae]AUH33210.1 DNA mismatch repair protein MutS [Paracoccus tegillarcae]
MARRRGLSTEDRELWSRVAQTATPLHPALKKRTPAPAPKPDNRGADVPKFNVKPFRAGQSSRPALAQSSAMAPSPAERLAQHALRMDHKTHRKMQQGKLRPEARLDLHGMTLAQAHPELMQFVLSCQAAGKRLVLIITGKGRGDHGPLPTRPGALRHQVPIWLHQPPLAAAVQQVQAAHYRHGGEGAYYVYLRR